MQHRFEDEMRDILERIRQDLDQGITRQIGESGGGPNQPIGPRIVGVSLVRNGYFNHSFQSWYPKTPIPTNGNYECAWWYSHPTTPGTPMVSTRTGSVSFRTVSFDLIGSDTDFRIPRVIAVARNLVITTPEASLIVTPAP